MCAWVACKAQVRGDAGLRTVLHDEQQTARLFAGRFVLFGVRAKSEVLAGELELDARQVEVARAVRALLQDLVDRQATELR